MLGLCCELRPQRKPPRRGWKKDVLLCARRSVSDLASASTKVLFGLPQPRQYSGTGRSALPNLPADLERHTS
jgi:hypothetical protein